MSVFIDNITVEVQAGRGGNGMVAFRREKYVEYGGPSGGNGGAGGSIIFVGEEGKNTLIDLAYKRHIKGKNGENGGIKGMTGANAPHTYVRVPLGSIITKLDGTLIGEITIHNQELVIAKGGRGGRGNIAFASNKNQAPDFAEGGEIGDAYKINVELKILADAGLLGYPSVGKSTLISIISNAKPKIADYPFTTLNPNLGLVQIDESSYVVADLPGLIENAHLGVGLGIQFLRHIERCRLLIHIVSMDSDDPYQDYLNINKELSLYDEELSQRKQLIVASKMDVENADKKLEVFKSKVKPHEVIAISAITNQNIDLLKYKILEELKSIPRYAPIQPRVEYTLKEEEAPFIVNKSQDGVYELTGDKLYRMFMRIDFNNDSAVKRFSRQLRGLGVDEKLRELGIKNGDIVRIFTYEFEFID